MSVKKKWSGPELVVLTRGTSEESVLDGCKGAPASHIGGPHAGGQTCQIHGAQACEFVAGS